MCVQEAGMMASMRHPNVVMYLGVCLQPPCVVTEYCARGSLNDVFKRARATPALAAQLDWGRRCAASPLPPFAALSSFVTAEASAAQPLLQHGPNA